MGAWSLQTPVAEQEDSHRAPASGPLKGASEKRKKKKKKKKEGNPKLSHRNLRESEAALNKEHGSASPGSGSTLQLPGDRTW